MKRLFFVLIMVVAVFTAHAQNLYDVSLQIFFPANSANFKRVSQELAQQNQNFLAEIAQILLDNPQYRILIDGHANPVLGTNKEEIETLTPLSLQRATTVANYLVETYKIDRQRLILTGAGGRYASGKDAAQNRHVSFYIITDIEKNNTTENTITEQENITIAEEQENTTIAEEWDIPEDQGGLTEEIHNLIPDNYLAAIRELGIEINEGRNPPIIEGKYFVDTLLLVKNTTKGDIAKQWNQFVIFSVQDNKTLTINADYTMRSDNETAGPMSSKGPGSFIVGEGNKFTVVVDGTRKEGEFTAKTVEIFSGEISARGIINYHWAVFMINNNGDPLGHWIANGTGYAKRDGDGFSEKVF